MKTTFEQPALGRPTEKSSPPLTLAELQRELNDLIAGLALLGIKRCTQCKQFFSVSDPGALFGNGNLVCYACIPEWWHSFSAQSSVPDREKLETKLATWLRKYHAARTVKEERGRDPEMNPLEFQIVVHCGECAGTGKMQGARCRFCNGFGTVWIVAPRQ